jgi:transcriptional regulator with XRE-family HTH domain
MEFTPGQCRAARALIGWSQDQLASASNVAKATIANFELGKRTPYDRTLDDLVGALEAAGVEFTNGEQPGVRMSKKSFGRRAMPNEIRIGDRIMLRDNIAVPFIRSIGSIGDVVDPGHTVPDATKVYVRFPNGDEGWVDRGCLVLAP